MGLPAAFLALARLARQRRMVEEDRGDPQADDWPRRSREIDDELDEIEDEEEEGG